MSEIVSIPPSVTTMVERSLANYCNSQGNQKIFYLLDSIDNLRNFIMIQKGERYIIDLVNKELKEYTIFKIKDYADLDKFIEKSRQKINEAEFLYNRVKDKKSSEKGEVEKLISKKISPYQKELHFLFHLLLKISGNQNKIISRELLRNPEQSRFEENSFKDKEKI